MAARSAWKGYLRVSLVTFSVKAYSATSSTSPIHLNQLHKSCNNRIKYQKVCPEHGEVSNDEIVSGYEYEKGQYAVIDVDQLDLLRTESDRSINVDCFVAADALNSMYETEGRYYLVPNDSVGQKPYALIRDAMAETGLTAIAQVVISKKEQLVRIRPLGKLLTMTVLYHAAEVKQPASFEDEIESTATDPQEMKLARQLLEGLQNDEFDLSKYPDRYTEKLTALIEAKVAGRELVSVPTSGAPAVINLMEALKASVQQVRVPGKQPAREPAKGAPPPKQVASRKTRRETPDETKAAGKPGKKKTG